MDNIVIISALLFFVADIFAVASLANPDWIISNNAMMTQDKFGLTTQCLTIFGRDSVCLSPNLPPEWAATLLFVVLGILCLTLTCILSVLSIKNSTLLKYTRWAALAAIIQLCIAVLIFPLGFYVEEIGGRPYKLPKSIKVGSSYVMFILSIFIAIVSELFASKICSPRF